MIQQSHRTRDKSRPNKPRSGAGLTAGVVWLASALFFLSGSTGLIYQVVWFKRFSHVWGSSSLAFAAVGGSFLFGLGLGAYLLGRLADRVAWPLKWYGLSELLIGALALVIPFEIAALVDASVPLYAALPEQPLWRFFVQFCVTLLVIGPPCVLMGGTLPLLIRQLTARSGSLDQVTGWLYAINTFGAAAGCYLAGFHLLPWLGLLGTNNLAAGMNLAIGAVALAVSRSLQAHVPRKAVLPPPEASWQEQTSGGTLRLMGLYFATALTGCAALVLEMTWTRQLALVLGGSTYALTATLFVVLCGIALGSLAFHVFLRRAASSPTLLTAVVGVLAVSVLVGKVFLPRLSIWVGEAMEFRGDAFWNGVLCAGASGMLELLPAVAMGILFPLFVHLTHETAARVGSAVGKIYAFNTLGSIFGASLTALILFPWIGTTGAMGLAVAMYVVALLAVLPWQTRGDLVRASMALGVGAALVAFIARPTDPRLTNSGLYMYPDAAARSGGPTQLRPLYFREGASANVLVTRLGTNVSLRVNGKVDASNVADMETQLGLAYFPRFLMPTAKEVMVIGFGSGCTSGKSLLFADTRVTCCEIEPAVFGASEQFAAVNSRPQEKTRAWLEARNAERPPEERLSAEQIRQQARLSMVFGDGRTAIQGSSQKFDLIISEPSNPWLAGVSNLFTREFFHTVREHLSEDGVLAQWIQSYNFTASDYLMIVRTLRREFSHFGVISLAGGADTILLASQRPLLPNREALKSMQDLVDASPEISADLKYWLGGTDVRYLLLLALQLGQERLNQLVDKDRSRELNTDLHLRLEFDAPLHLFRKIPSDEQASQVLFAVPDVAWEEKLASQLDIDRQQGEFSLTVGNSLLRQAMNPFLDIGPRRENQLKLAAIQFEKALALRPEWVDALKGLAATRYLQNPGKHADQIAEWLRLAPNDPAAHACFAQSLKADHADEIVAHYREALRLTGKLRFEDGSVMWANNLAWILATNPSDKLRNGSEAVRWAKAACDTDAYQTPELLDTLAAALAETGNFEQAIEVCRRIVELTSELPKVVDMVRERIGLFEQSRPFRDG